MNIISAINKANLLLTGESYKKILVSNEKSDYFQNHAFVVGSDCVAQNNLFEMFNKNVLVTLQFTHDHTDKQNAILLNELSEFILSSPTSINFYLKHHPRFNNDVDLSVILANSNVKLSPNDINACFELCSLHATTYSTSTFEAALLGIPTILISTESKFNYFQKDFNYPLNSSINDFNKISFYQEKSKIVKEWATSYYTPYNEIEFLNLLR